MPEGYIGYRTETGRNLTPKQEAFAQLYIETGNASEAYRCAYTVRETTKAASVWESASKLLAHPKVSSRVAELQAAHRARHNTTVDTLTNEYEDARRLAMATGQPSAAVSATTGKARIHGLDKGEGGGTDEGDGINIQINFTEPPKVIEHAPRFIDPER